MKPDKIMHHRCKLLIGLTALTLLAGCRPDPFGPFRLAENQITARSLLTDVEALSSDQMEGRATGTLGEDKAAAFIAEQFAQAGLLPLRVSGSERERVHANDYFQPVRLVGMKKVVDSSRLEIRNEAGPLAFTPGESLTFWSTAQQNSVDITDAPLLFVGYGVEAPEYDWDDLKGVVGRLQPSLLSSRGRRPDTCRRQLLPIRSGELCQERDPGALHQARNPLC